MSDMTKKENISEIPFNGDLPQIFFLAPGAGDPERGVAVLSLDLPKRSKRGLDIVDWFQVACDQQFGLERRPLPILKGRAVQNIRNDQDRNIKISPDHVRQEVRWR